MMRLHLRTLLALQLLTACVASVTRYQPEPPALLWYGFEHIAAVQYDRHGLRAGLYEYTGRPVIVGGIFPEPWIRKAKR